MLRLRRTALEMLGNMSPTPRYRVARDARDRDLMSPTLQVEERLPGFRRAVHVFVFFSSCS
jgi:hypothetical protein